MFSTTIMNNFAIQESRTAGHRCTTRSTRGRACRPAYSHGLNFIPLTIAPLLLLIYFHKFRFIRVITKARAFSTAYPNVIRYNSRISMLIHTRIASNRVRHTIHITEHLEYNLDIRPYPQVIKACTFKRTRNTNSFTDQRLIIFKRRLPRRVHRIAVLHTRIVGHRNRIRFRATLFSNNKGIPTSFSLFIVIQAIKIGPTNNEIR